jgi:hypothetical protein
MKKYFNIILFTVAITGLSSCLKDDNANLTANNSPAVVEWSTTAGDVPTSPSGSTYALYERSFVVSPSIDVPFVVNYTGGSAAPSDITVNIGIKNDAITQYNQERLDRDHITTHLEPLAAANYTFPSSVVIKKGERKATVIVKLNTTLITDFDAEYVLALSITSASNNTTVSGNYGTILVKTLVKNKYDGAYNVTGTMTDATSAANTGAYPREMYLVTKGASSNAEFDPNLNGGTFFHYFLAGGAGSYFGNTCPVFTFNANDEVASAVNLYGQGTNPQGRGIRLGAGSVNKWTIKPTANNQTLEVQYIMTQGGADRVTWTETWVYKGPRP